MNSSSLGQSLEFSRQEIEATVTARWAQVVERFAENVALRGDDFCWTYRQLDRRVQQMARAIRRNTPEERGCVAFVCEISPWMVVASLAILQAGKIQLPLHPEQPLKAHQQTLRQAPPQLLLCSHLARDQGIELAGPYCRCESLEEFGLDQDPSPFEEVNESSDPCTLYFTSGSTGCPKGVIKSHRSLLHRCWLGGQHDQISPADRQSLLTHASFASSEADIFATLLHGACLCVFDIARHGLAGFRDWIIQERISLLHPPVLFFRKFLQSLQDHVCFDTVRLVALAGEVVVPPDLAAWARHFPRHCQLRHRFSCTETALLTVAHLNTWDRPTERVPWGRPVADKILEIWGPEQQRLGPGEVGELVVRSAYLADGYWQCPEETASRFLPDPHDPGRRVFRTGDLGRIQVDGSFEFLGRRDGQVKIRGYRVSTLEVEEALLQVPAVSEASVAAQDSQLIAHVVLTGSCTAAELRSELAQSLAEWKIPTQIHLAQELPKTLTGKVDRPRVRRNQSLLDRLGQLWQHQLERPPVGVDEDLLRAGGDSITVVLLLNLVEQEWGVSLTPAEFFENRTLSGLAQKIAAASPSPEPPGVQAASPSDEKNVADFFLEQLVELGIDYVFLNPGTDSAPILESWVKFEAQGRPAPTMVLCLHEAVALAAAHGYFMVSGKPQVVFVHVDLGTQNLGGNLHNAQRGQAGVILCAGRAPFAVDSRVAGGRDRYAHWIQEQKHQAGIVADYVKWHYQLPHQENLGPALDRALQLSACSPAGPVYLTLPREILLESLRSAPAQRREIRRSRDVADLASLQQALDWLLQARAPLVIVSRLGRNPEAVADLVSFAEFFALAIVESRHRHNFPLDHPLHLGFQPLAHLHESDLVIVIDHEVPWIPDQWRPHDGCRVLQIDQDTEKDSIPIWGFPVDLALKGDSQIALQALCRLARGQVTDAQKVIFGQRFSRIEALHQRWREHCRERAAASSGQRPIAPEWMGHCLAQVVGEKTLVVCEAATNNPILWEYLTLPQAGGFFQSLGSSLGWGLGAALGAKLARPDREVVCVMGDGAWMFSNPLASYESARQLGVTFLTVVLNNQKYAAINEAVQSLAPSGWSRRLKSYPASSLPGTGYYQRVAGAIGMWSRTCHDPDRLCSDLEEALHQVRQGTPALLEICLSSPHH